MPVRTPSLALTLACVIVAAGCGAPAANPVATAAPATAPASLAPSRSAEPPTAAPSPRPSNPASADPGLVPCQQGIASVEIEVNGPRPQDVTPVLAVGDDTIGAVLAMAPLPDDATAVLLGACLWAPGGGDSQPLVNAGAVPATRTPGLSLERIVRTQDAPVAHVLAGRATPEIVAAEVTLADGSAVAGTVADGYWIALWTGPSGSTNVIGRDASGAAVTTIPIDDMAP